VNPDLLFIAEGYATVPHPHKSREQLRPPPGN